MATPAVAASPRVTLRQRPATDGRRRTLVTLVLTALLVLLVWEGVKFLGGVPWRPIGAGPTLASGRAVHAVANTVASVGP